MADTVTDHDSDPELADPFTTTLTIPNAARADILAAELRKVRDALNFAYKTAMLGHNVPIYHPAMQGLAAAAVNIEGTIQALDPPRVQQVVGPGTGLMGDRGVPGMGRA
jgi:hypothetical protein